MNRIVIRLHFIKNKKYINILSNYCNSKVSYKNIYFLQSKSFFIKRENKKQQTKKEKELEEKEKEDEEEAKRKFEEEEAKIRAKDEEERGINDVKEGEELYYDLELSKSFKHKKLDKELEQDVNYDAYKLDYKEFKDGKYLIISEDKNYHFAFYFFNFIYGFVILFLFVKIFNNRDKNKTIKHLWNIIYLSSIILVSTRIYFNYEKSKYLIKRIYLLSDGKRLKLNLYDYSEKTYFISQFKKLDKELLTEISPEILICAVEEGYVMLGNQHFYIIPFRNEIVNQEILTKVCNSENIEIIY